MKKRLLDGIKVVDFSQIATGPLTTKYLADWGATVLKIEGRSRIDAMRNNPPFKDGIPGLNRAGRFNQWNSSKMSTALNLRRPRAVELAKRFVAWGDVVIDNFASGVMERLGLGYEDLKQVKPDIIMISSSLLGHSGPYSESRGFGTILSALSGFNQITGWPDREPPDLGVYTDFIGHHFHAFIILAALINRRHTGQGQYIDISQFQCALQFIAPLLLDYSINGRVAERLGNRSTSVAPHGAYPCLGEDRWCAIAVYSDQEWQSLCQIMGNPAWTNDPRFSTLLARKKNEDELDKLIGAWTVTQRAEDIMGRLQAAGVPAGLLETGEDLIEHNPQLKHLRFFCEVPHPEIGKYIVHRTPFTLSRAAYEVTRAPLLGEHNQYALKEILGLSDEEMADLVIDGAVE